MENTGKFSLKIKKVKFDAFYLTRLFWHIEAQGKEWQKIVFYTVYWFVLMPLGLAVDLLLIVIYFFALVLAKLLKTLFLWLLDLLKKFFQLSIFPAIKTVLIFLFLFVLAVLLYYKFDFFKDLILKTFELFAQ